MIGKAMELSQLKMFKVIVEQGSIVKASRVLHCVPSNITNRIKLLEQELGVDLFIRKGRGLIISPLGELFLGYCLLYTSPSPRDRQKSRMPSSA